MVLPALWRRRSLGRDALGARPNATRAAARAASWHCWG